MSCECIFFVSKQIVTFNVLSIVSAVFASVLIGIAVPGAVLQASRQYYCDDYYYDCYFNRMVKDLINLPCKYLV